MNCNPEIPLQIKNEQMVLQGKSPNGDLFNFFSGPEDNGADCRGLKRAEELGRRFCKQHFIDSLP